MTESKNPSQQELNRQNMRPLDYLNYQMQGLSQREKDEILQRKLEVQKKLIETVHRPLVLNNEIVDILVAGQPTEDQVKEWAEAAKQIKLSEQPKATVNKHELPVPRYPTRPRGGYNADIIARTMEEKED